MTFEIIDNFISEESQQYIQRMFESDQFCWRCVDTLNYDPGVQENSKLFNRKMFSSRLWYGDGYMDEVVKHFPLPEFKTHNLMRAKVNLNLQRREKSFLAPHADSLDPGTISYFYYVNESDGSTVIYPDYVCSHTRHPNSRPPFWIKKVKIKPKRGRIVKIPANLLHSDDVPNKYSTRIVLNFVFEPKPLLQYPIR